MHLLVRFDRENLEFDLGVKGITCHISQVKTQSRLTGLIQSNQRQESKNELKTDARLDRMGGSFKDDNGQLVDSRCIMLMAGRAEKKEENECGLRVFAVFNIFDAPAKKKIFDMEVILDEFTMKVTPDVVQQLVAITKEFQ